MHVLARAVKGSRRAQLLRCAKAVFAERGYHAASIADVIAAAGIARGTFYLYFPGKREIFDAILDGLLEELDRNIAVIETGPSSPPPLAQLRANLERVLSLILEDPHLVAIVLFQAAGLDRECRHKLDRFYQSILGKIEAALRAGMMLGLVRPCDPRVTAAAILGAVQGIVAQAARQEQGYDLERIVDEVLAFGLHGVLALPCRLDRDAPQCMDDSRKQTMTPAAATASSARELVIGLDVDQAIPMKNARRKT